MQTDLVVFAAEEKIGNNAAKEINSDKIVGEIRDERLRRKITGKNVSRRGRWQHPG